MFSTWHKCRKGMQPRPTPTNQRPTDSVNLCAWTDRQIHIQGYWQGCWAVSLMRKGSDNEGANVDEVPTSIFATVRICDKSKYGTG